jgi:hypothetical protein
MCAHVRQGGAGVSGEDLAMNRAVAKLHNAVHHRSPPLSPDDTQGWDHLQIYRLHSARTPHLV